MSRKIQSSPNELRPYVLDKWYDWRLYIVVIIVFLIAFGVGWGAGVFQTLNWAVEKGLYFLNINDIDLNISKEELFRGVWRYKEEINDHFPTLPE